MLTFLLWCIVLFFCWPLALLVLVLYPLVWLFLLPFRILGFAVEGVLELLKAIILLPARVLRDHAAPGENQYSLARSIFFNQKTRSIRSGFLVVP